jgi:hypothetical protein
MNAQLGNRLKSLAFRAAGAAQAVFPYLCPLGTWSVGMMINSHFFGEAAFCDSVKIAADY